MTRAWIAAAWLAGPVAAVGAGSVPNHFVAGTRAEAAKVNENFADVIAKITALEAQLAAVAPPVGTVLAFAGDASAEIPPGFLLCDGRAVSRSTYATLFSVLGIAHGGGDGATTFNLPDYRGRFLRGRDGGAARDPDRLSRTAPQPGSASTGATGDAVGSVQTGQLAGHGHGVNDPTHGHDTSESPHVHGLQQDLTVNPHGYNAGGFVGSDRNSATQLTDARVTGLTVVHGATGVTIQTSGGAETRPANAYVNYIIKH